MPPPVFEFSLVKLPIREGLSPFSIRNVVFRLTLIDYHICLISHLGLIEESSIVPLPLFKVPVRENFPSLAMRLILQPLAIVKRSVSVHADSSSSSMVSLPLPGIPVP